MPAAEGGGKEGGGERFLLFLLPPHSPPVLRSLPPRSRAPFAAPARVRAPTWAARPPPVRKQFGQLSLLPRRACVPGGQRWGARGRSVPAPSRTAGPHRGAAPGPPSPARPGGHRGRHQVEGWEG